MAGGHAHVALPVPFPVRAAGLGVRVYDLHTHNVNLRPECQLETAAGRFGTQIASQVRNLDVALAFLLGESYLSRSFSLLLSSVEMSDTSSL